MISRAHDACSDRHQGPNVRYKSPSRDEDETIFKHEPLCGKPCAHRMYPLNQLVVACHQDCVRVIVPRTFSDCRGVAEWAYEPESTNSRRTWLHHSLTQRLELGTFLSPEVRHNIAQYLTREYAALLQTRPLRGRST